VSVTAPFIKEESVGLSNRTFAKANGSPVGSSTFPDIDWPLTPNANKNARINKNCFISKKEKLKKNKDMN
jgi:hypothetical protein